MGDTQTSTAVGADGLGIVASYGELGTQDLTVSHCADANCATVTTHSIDTSGNAGSGLSLKIGRDGLPIISYLVLTSGLTGTLKVAHCADASCSSATITTVDPASTTSAVEGQTSLTIGASGLADIAFLRTGLNSWVDVRLAHCQNAVCTSFTTSTVDTIKAPGAEGIGDLALAANQAGELNVVYPADYPTAGHLIEATCATEMCDSRSIATHIATADTPGTTVSLAIGTDGLPLIAFNRVHGSAMGLAVAHCANLSCTDSTSAYVDSDGEALGGFNATAIGGDGLGVVVYTDTTNFNLEVAHCADIVCTSLTRSIVDEFDVQGDGESWIAVGPDGQPLISYIDGSDPSNVFMKALHCGDVACAQELIAPF